MLHKSKIRQALVNNTGGFLLLQTHMYRSFRCEGNTGSLCDKTLTTSNTRINSAIILIVLIHEQYILP